MSPGMLDLLANRRFAPLLLTQALGALNDNLFKGALVALVTFRARAAGLSAEALVQLSTALLMLPFFLFSALAGQLADRFDKARLMRLLKAAELGVMLLAAVGFASGNLWLLFAALFLMGTQSAFFGPLKYAVLPQHLADSQLVAGNALVELSTFVAIVLGTLLGGALLESTLGAGWIGASLLLVAAAGYLASRAIPAAPPAEAAS